MDIFPTSIKQFYSLIILIFKDPLIINDQILLNRNFLFWRKLWIL